MRLINADALIKDLSKEWNVLDELEFANKAMWKVIDAQPTIEERKKGMWLHTDTEPDEGGHYPLGWMPWYCSECGTGIGKHQTAFCPNCGADMRGEDDERA